VAGYYYYKEFPLPVSSYMFLDPAVSFNLPHSFDFEGYIDAERELWAFFPETYGKRVNFCQLGLSARVYVEVPASDEAIGQDETYFLMPCEDGTLRPVRMRSERTLTLDEFRMSHLTAIRMGNKLLGTGKVLEEVHRQVLGAEIVGEISREY
jgi:hypothetical protein